MHSIYIYICALPVSVHMWIMCTWYGPKEKYHWAVTLDVYACVCADEKLAIESGGERKGKKEHKNNKIQIDLKKRDEQQQQQLMCALCTRETLVLSTYRMASISLHVMHNNKVNDGHS